MVTTTFVHTTSLNRLRITSMSAAMQMKMAASLTCDIKPQVVKLSFDSVPEIGEEMSTNVSQFISLLHVNSFR